MGFGVEDGQTLFEQRATALWWAHSSTNRGRDYLCGPAFLVGPADRHGDDMSAPEYLVDLLLGTKRYRVQVQTQGTTGWHGNELVFTDWYTAYASILDLAERWSSVEEVRVIPEPDEELLNQWLGIGRENAWIKYADDPRSTGPASTVSVDRGAE